MSSNSMRVTGLVSGMDTDASVKQLMKPYQTRLDKMNQNKQIIQWQQDAYRSFLADLNTFRSTYFDILKPETNMLSQSAYTNFETTVYEAGTSTVSAGVTANGSSDAIAGTYGVNFTGGNLAVSAGVLSDTKMVGAKSSTLLKDLGITSTSITLSYSGADGVAKTADLTIDPNTLTIAGLASAVNTATSGEVSMNFSEITGKVKFQTKDTGLNTSFGITDNTVGGAFLEGLNLAVGGSGATVVDSTDGTYGVLGKDLSVKITVPGQAETTVTNSSNTYIADGINFTFTSAAKNLDIKVQPNNTKTFDKIKAFVDKYNEMVDKIGVKVEEKKQYTFLPLTDAQKSAMSEADVTKWEDKAKQGNLSGDMMFQNMLYSMRSAFYSGVKDAGVNLSDIGLSTSQDTTQRGKIIIDETKLKAAIANNSDKINELFTKTSTTQPSYDPNLTSAERKVRFDESGIFQRINDVMLDYTRTTRDSGGKKGILLEKAGIKGDFSEYSNLLTKDLNDRQTNIDKFIRKMSEKQEKYYLQFAKLETAMNTSNAQSSWLSQQIGAMNK